MLTPLPLDDELNQLFYLEEGTWRLVWANALGRVVLRREEPRIEFINAVAMITVGQLLWAPPPRFVRLSANTPVDAVRREHALLRAYLASPAGQRVTKWTTRQRLELRVADDRDWLARRALTRGDAGPPDAG